MLCCMRNRPLLEASRLTAIQRWSNTMPQSETREGVGIHLDALDTPCMLSYHHDSALHTHVQQVGPDRGPV